MITKVVHGWRPAGLLAYLLGPGIAEVHRNPRVIASWDGLDAGWQPASTGPGEWDLELGPLVDALHQPVLAAGLPLRPPPDAGRGYVWHCSVRLAASDARLPDGEWAEIARELLRDAGIADPADAYGPRWVAVRHAEDHIHIAAVLVRQDNGARVWPRNDFARLRESARRIEARLGLTPTGTTAGGGASAPTRGELAKAAREGRVPVRAALRAAVRRAALGADDMGSFVAGLEAAGLEVKLRHGPSGDVLGYSVGQPADLLAAGEVVFYSGSKLAPDLSLPRLQRRWATTTGGARPRPSGTRVLTRAARLVVTDQQAGAVEHGAADLLTALSVAAPAGDRERWQRAADIAHQLAPPAGSGSSTVGRQLRVLARSLMRHRGFASRDEVGAAAFAAAMAHLFVELAALQQRRARTRAELAHRAVLAADLAERIAALPIPQARRASVVQHEAARTPTRTR
ncbi:relaxase/mobilization nuclease domain-containing protein [Pseudonocardia oroxyli]|uniref:MobA/VirD2-like nuclease domain-containing protein n=1 Tax=Pseudonocardia oroxyli TaxID=366584 RepID=A0A1G7TEQ2_PSEOR|nr:hypothetical protein [Pseudonocardia oroxyli]SDG33796.1 hypothetical protein SAMN05216377_1118 [Pseudonocardia oroxyli]